MANLRSGAIVNRLLAGWLLAPGGCDQPVSVDSRSAARQVAECRAVLRAAPAVSCDELLRKREVEEFFGVLVRDEVDLILRNSVEDLLRRQLGLGEGGVSVWIVGLPQDPVDPEIVPVLDAYRLLDHAEVHASLRDLGRFDVCVLDVRPVLMPLPLAVRALDRGWYPADAALGPDHLGIGVPSQQRTHHEVHG